MSCNYDSSQVGVPYVRIPEVTISYDTEGKTVITAKQEMAVKLADGKIANLKEMTPISFTVNLATEGNTTAPLVHPTTGLPLGSYVTYNQVMLTILAPLRVKQVELNV